jgi:hypothetical protein
VVNQRRVELFGMATTEYTGPLPFGNRIVRVSNPSMMVNSSIDEFLLAENIRSPSALQQALRISRRRALPETDHGGVVVAGASFIIGIESLGLVS